MNSRIIKILLVFLFGAALMIGSAFAEGDGGNKKTRLNKPDGAPIRAFMNINNISTVIKNTGISDIDVGESNPQVRVGGSTYAEGLQGGAILSDGTVEDADAPHVRIYRVRPTVYPGGPSVDVSVEANDEGKSEADVRAQYELDWAEWPAEYGAPYYDGNDNDMYDPIPDPVDSLRDIPGVPGADQTIWYVYGTAPLGIEMQATFWAYAQTGALGNMFFRKYVLTNKTDVWTGGNPSGPQTFRDMYVSMWSDPDVGNSTDDFAGSDTVLSLSYAYNALANDPTYNPLPPPAAGFDFFQGPLLDGVAGEDRNKNGIDDAEDFAIFNGETVGPGKINLPMTSSYYFARGDPSVTDPTLQSSAGADQFYNFFQGKIGLTGAFFVDPVTGLETTFTLTGDAQTQTGWVDGILIGPADRRIGMAAGPFDMAPGEVQEVVVAEICAGAIPGVDRLSAIGLLKFYDQIAQVAYDNFFDLPIPPPRPSVEVVELNRTIVLDWGEDQDKVNATESFDDKGYVFEGYNIYQLPSAAASVGEGVRVATFDVINGVGKISDFVFDPTLGEVIRIPVQFGNDTGIERFIEITIDRINGGVPLINGIRYHFAVTAYNYNPSPTAIPNNLENPIQILTVIPQDNAPGVTYGAEYQDTLDVAHVEGQSDGDVFPLVIDPSALTGLVYTITFDTIPGGEVVWNADRSDGVRVLENQTNQNADAESPIADGLQFRVIGAPETFKLFEVVANASGVLDPTEPGAVDFQGFPTQPSPIDDDPNPTERQQVGDGHWAFHTWDDGGTNDGGTRGSFDTWITRTTRNGFDNIIPNDFEMRFTAAGGYASGAVFGDITVQVPFEIWNIGSNTPDDPSDDFRMVPWFIDLDENGAWDMGSWGDSNTPGSGAFEHSASGGNNDPYTDAIYWAQPEDISPGSAGYDAAETEMIAGTYDGSRETEVLARTVLMNWNGGEMPPFTQALPEEGTIFRLTSTKPNGVGVDVFAFTAPAETQSGDLARNQIGDINVFPNPYYGINSEEINKYNRFVTFTHLPEKAKIRIFNLAGVLVRTIEKDDIGQYQRWDLK